VGRTDQTRNALWIVSNSKSGALTRVQMTRAPLLQLLDHSLSGLGDFEQRKLIKPIDGVNAKMGQCK